MAIQRVDFKELRQQLRFADVLKLYNVDFKVDRTQQNVLCPLPRHKTTTEGRKRTPSLSVNLIKGIWNCHGCGAKGNLIEFAALMDGLNPDNSAEFRQTALKLQQSLIGSVHTTGTGEKKAGESEPTPAPKATKPESQLVVNAPLDFELQDLDFDHPYLKSRGYSADTIGLFGLGYCARGMMKDRVVIPLHDQQGMLIGYAGRLVDDSVVDEDTPKYRFPGPREKGGLRFELHKSEFLYHGHAAFDDAPIKRLIIVEGFPSVWWLHQAGITDVVATMGSSLSDAQAELVIEHVAKDGLIYAMSDGDAAGEKLAVDIFQKIAAFLPVRWVKLDGGKQPTDLPADELVERLR